MFPTDEYVNTKAAQHTTANQAQSGAIGGYAVDELPSGLGIRGRVARDKRRAQDQSAKACLLHELEYLLEKNPDVARILDLLEAVRA